MSGQSYMGPEGKEGSDAPRIPPELVVYLKRMFPNRCPRLNDNDRDIWAAVGAASVVTHLEALLEQQHSKLI